MFIDAQIILGNIKGVVRYYRAMECQTYLGSNTKRKRLVEVHRCPDCTRKHKGYCEILYKCRICNGGLHFDYLCPTINSGSITNPCFKRREDRDSPQLCEDKIYCALKNINKEIAEFIVSGS